MANATPLSEAEIKGLAVSWYQKLDVHAPLEEVVPMLATEGLEMRFPEATLQGTDGFAGWYEGVTRRFFDEIHTVKSVESQLHGDTADVKVVVNWQAKVWNPPAPKSVWLGFDAYQTWVVKRDPVSGKPVVAIYIVDSLDPMPGSANL